MTTLTASPERQRTIAAMIVYATDLVQAYPAASQRAIADKLLTVFDDSYSVDRMSVAFLVRDLILLAA